jgi:hypothetical protein
VSGAPIHTSNLGGQDKSQKGALRGYGKSLAFVLVISAGLLLSLVFTVNNQHIPHSFVTNVIFAPFPVGRSIDMITLTREPLILVPFSSVIPNHMVNSTLRVSIYHHLNNGTIPDRMKVVKVTLSSPQGSILTYNPQFDNRTTSHAPNSNINVDNYVLEVTARHNLDIGNMSGTYNLTIFYTDPNHGPMIKQTLPTSPIKQTSQTVNPATPTTTRWIVAPTAAMQYLHSAFVWPIKTTDLPPLTYFWIVLIGVILSKLSTRIISEKQKRSNNPPPPTTTASSSPISSLSNFDYLWIGISAIIALLIFSSFQQQVHLTGNILYNISLAFAFGFGFDRVLDTTSNLASTKTH